MCGLAGYSGIKPSLRRSLSTALGLLLDTRGGHGAGFFTLRGESEALSVHKTSLTWAEGGPGFLYRCVGDTVAMHSRYATCGAVTKACAHPFKVKKGTNGEGLLVGMHNGCVWNAEEHARKAGRPYTASTVDSLELFRQLASDDTLGTLSGYGSIAWHEVGKRGVRICRVTEQADLVCASVKGGKGLVWGSTKTIVEQAMNITGMKVGGWYELVAGCVYRVQGGKLYDTEQTLKLSGYNSNWTPSWMRDLSKEDQEWYDRWTEKRDNARTDYERATQRRTKSYESWDRGWEQDSLGVWRRKQYTASHDTGPTGYGSDDGDIAPRSWEKASKNLGGIPGNDVPLEDYNLKEAQDYDNARTETDITSDDALDRATVNLEALEDKQGDMSPQELLDFEREALRETYGSTEWEENRPEAVPSYYRRAAT